jgi:hypothetical protein
MFFGEFWSREHITHVQFLKANTNTVWYRTDLLIYKQFSSVRKVLTEIMLIISESQKVKRKEHRHIEL